MLQFPGFAERVPVIGMAGNGQLDDPGSDEFKHEPMLLELVDSLYRDYNVGML